MGNAKSIGQHKGKQYIGVYYGVGDGPESAFPLG
jgi:hypothetical protein